MKDEVKMKKVKRLLKLPKVKFCFQWEEFDYLYQLLGLLYDVQHIIKKPSDFSNITKYLMKKGMSVDEIMSKVTNIAQYMFYDLNILKEVVIPANIRRIECGAFNCCKELEQVSFDDGNLVEIVDFTAFADCPKLKKIDFGNCNHLREIGSYSFSACRNLTAIVLPPNLKSIEGFESCSGLTEIVLPSTVELINGGAFNNCTELKSITIPSSVKYIGCWAFHNCVKLKDVYYQGTKEQWGKICFDENCGEILNANIHVLNN